MASFFFFWLHCMAYGILVPGPGIEPVSPAVDARSLNHWTTKEVLAFCFFFQMVMFELTIRNIMICLLCFCVL